jgi:hypothetical protein
MKGNRRGDEPGQPGFLSAEPLIRRFEVYPPLFDPGVNGAQAVALTGSRKTGP